MNRMQETRLKKLGAIEQVRSARARRYVFHPDEVAEAEAKACATFGPCLFLAPALLVRVLYRAAPRRARLFDFLAQARQSRQFAYERKVF